MSSTPEREVDQEASNVSTTHMGKTRGWERKRGRAQRKEGWTKSVRNCDVTLPAGTQVKANRKQKCLVGNDSRAVQ